MAKKQLSDWQYSLICTVAFILLITILTGLVLLGFWLIPAAIGNIIGYVFLGLATFGFIWMIVHIMVVG